MIIIGALSFLLQAAVVSSSIWPHHSDSHHHDGPRILNSFQWHAPLDKNELPPDGYEVRCHATKTFYAKQFRLDQLKPPSPWAFILSTYLGWHTFPGTWGGLDKGGDEREIIIMEYKDVPQAVRDWIDDEHRIKDQEKSKWWMYGVFEKPGKELEEARVVEPKPKDLTPEEQQRYKDIPAEKKVLVFAAAALYENMPLWVAKGSSCEGESTIRAIVEPITDAICSRNIGSFPVQLLGERQSRSCVAIRFSIATENS
jgi:hypothetical protein